MIGVIVASDNVLVILVAALIICGMVILPAAAEEVHQVPAVYVFGDSTVDVGNLKYLPGNFTPSFPYGIDFPLADSSRPNGRFSNGYNLADCISRLLGFDMSPPAYLSLTPETSGQILKGFGGVNYAAGGSGILDATGNASLPLSKQMEYFAATKANMTEESGGNSTDIDALLSRSLFLISDGGNDMFEFFTHKPSIFKVRPFYNDLLSNYTKYVETLYGLGARRFGVIDVPPIGCVPVARAKIYPIGKARCEAFANKLARDFNDALGKAMAKLAASLPGMRYSVGSSYNLVTYYSAHPEDAGFKVVNSACCGGRRLNGQAFCGSNSSYCVNRDEHLFWDGVHGTQATWNKGAEEIYAAPVEKGFAAPINFKQLLLDDERAYREKFPEKVPFRLTRMLVKAMEVSGIEGTFRTTCENVMQVLRTNKDSVMAMMEAFVHDPLINWRLFNFNEVPQVSNYGNAHAHTVVSSEEAAPSEELMQPPRGAREKELLQAVNQLGDANEVLNERAVAVMARMSHKLTGRDFSSGSALSGVGGSNQHGSEHLASVDAREVEPGLSAKVQVQKLILQATSHENLCQNYVGWCPFW